MSNAVFPADAVPASSSTRPAAPPDLAALADAIDPRIQQSRSGKHWYPPAEETLIEASDALRSLSPTAREQALEKALRRIAETAEDLKDLGHTPDYPTALGLMNGLIKIASDALAALPTLTPAEPASVVDEMLGARDAIMQSEIDALNKVADTLSAEPAADREAAYGWTLADLRAANEKRQAEWCPDPAQQPDLAFRAMELAGETGEACNVAKKLVRERHGWRGSRAMPQDDLGDELADIIICADLTAMAEGIDLMEAVRRKFNATTEKVGLTTFLSPTPQPQAPSPAESEREAFESAYKVADGLMGLEAVAQHIWTSAIAWHAASTRQETASPTAGGLTAEAIQSASFAADTIERAAKEIGHQVRVEIYALAENTLEECHDKANDGGPDDHEHGYLRGRLYEAKSSSRALGSVLTDERIANIMFTMLTPAAPQPGWKPIETAPLGAIEGPFQDEYAAKSAGLRALESRIMAGVPSSRIETNKATVTTLWVQGRPVATTTVILSDFNTSYAATVALPVPPEGRK